MNKKELISIIVCAYNVESYIKECLESIINQTYKQLEIIIIDDGSTDNTSKICDEYQKKDKRIKVIHQSNKGLAVSKNIGLDNTHGNYISFIDPDDYVKKNFIEILYKTLKTKKVKMVMCNYKNKSDNILSKGINIFQEGYHTIDIMQKVYKNKNREGIYISWNKLCHKSIYENIRFMDVRYGEDTSVIYEILYNAKKIYYIDKELYIYRIRKESLTDKTSHINKLISLNKTTDHNKEICLKIGYTKMYIELVVEKLYNLLILYKIDSKNQNKYKKEYLKEYKEIKNKLNKKRNIFFTLCKILPSIYYWKVRLINKIDYNK